MTLSELIEYRNTIAVRRGASMRLVEQMNAAPLDKESSDQQADALAEGLFLRAFTAYENSIEKLFLHYVTGGASLGGAMANTYLSVTDETLARTVTLAGRKFFSWGKRESIQATARNYMENGWPISDMMNERSEALTDCQRIRNRIAHSSLHSRSEFDLVQRHLLRTERIFSITPGQLLRIRSAKSRGLHLEHYLDVMYDTLDTIIDPPP